MAPTLTVLLLLLTAVSRPGPAANAADTGESLKVSTDPRGGVTARGTLHLAAPPAALQAVLTDYEGWPELFSGMMRVGRVERQPDRTITDLYFKHSLLVGEQRLLCESRELPGGGLVTTLLGGDFKRYTRTWKVSPDGSAGGTKAEFHLEVEVDTLAPDWLVAQVMKRDLENHFRLLKEKTERLGRSSQR
jgi:hypothetical protein